MGKNYPEVNENQRLLEKSVKYFWGTIGYIGTLMAFLRDLDNECPNAKGRLYEIQCGVALHQSQKKEQRTDRHSIIEAFNVRKKVVKECGKIAIREFDIITDQLWMECKDRNFSRIQLQAKHGQEICAQLLEQKEIVELYNQQHQSSIHFQLNSKQLLPDSWKEWLDNNHIHFVDGH